MAVEARQLAAGRDLPEPDGLAFAHRGQAPAVGAEGHAPDEALVAVEGPDLGAGGLIPEPYGLVEAPRGEPRPVGTERRPVAPLGVPGELDRPCAGRHFPDLDVAEAGQGEPLPV